MNCFPGPVSCIGEYSVRGSRMLCMKIGTDHPGQIMTGDLEGWKLHVQALKEVIRLRGRPESLTFNTQLGLAISWWVHMVPFNYNNWDLRTI
jgi:hypothetical protein